MKVVASTDTYTIYLRRDGRHAVLGANKAPINGDEKVAILLEHGLITAPTPKAPAEPAAEDSSESSEGSTEESTEESSEESTTEAAADDETAAD